MKIIKSYLVGFTLLEGLFAISIISILMVIAFPSFTRMIESNRLSSASNEFLAGLIFTRSEAVKRSLTVSICTSQDGVSCSTELKDYAKGWIVFTDCNENSVLDIGITTCDLDGDGISDPDKLLRVQGMIKNISIAANTSSGLDAFSYRFSGRGIRTLSFKIGPDNTITKREIAIAITGRAKLRKVD